MTVELSGRWRVAAADDGLRRAYPDPGFDDSSWTELDVPGHWRSAPAFSLHDGPLLYRRAFDASRPAPGRRAWLVLDGLFYQGDVWLDGGYVGDTEGYFFPHAFEVTDALRDRSEHVLAVEVTCAPQRDRTAKRNLTGLFQHSGSIDPEWNPGGIWRDVRVAETGPVRISSLRLLCREATPERAVVQLRAELDAAGPGTACVHTTIGSTSADVDHTLAAGQNVVSWDVTVEQPELWWPRAIGQARLSDVTVSVRMDNDGEESDRRTLRTGLRQVRMRKWVLTVNGEPLFLKGVDVGPTRRAPADATAEEIAADVDRAAAAGLDLIRVRGHVARPELYDAADESGMLVWQDLPMQWGYARSVRKQAVRQAAAAVDMLGHHPSLAIWCGHNEPLSVDSDDVGATGARFLVQQELPTWNKTVLDASVRRALERADPTRPVIAHSGVLPHLGSGGTDAHLFFGWHHGDVGEFATWAARVPRLVRFVSEFGAQAVPFTDGFVNARDWPDLDWDRLERVHGMQVERMRERVPVEDFATFEQWREATQRYQAEIVRTSVETLRRLKYRPTGGFCVLELTDPQPAISFSLLDHERVPKRAYGSLAAACAPVIVVADRPAPRYEPGDAIELDVHVVSDLRHTLAPATVTARLRGASLDRDWTWEGDIGADSCTRVGTVQVVAAAATGDVTLELALDAPGVAATNCYTTRIDGGSGGSTRL